ncbi:carboxypeptidase-like regulatory domain-containing protein [Pontibacter sp. G13]|nr:carboxypeptidase-like regulatory domain-containing protein [Pontibacter sp. G13]WNJ15937.1 carboxypeptidase-like regulatory domain-containing protein [Pontibacter sp. G13]
MVFGRLESHYPVSFSYDDRLIDGIRVTARFRGIPLDTVLHRVLRNTELEHVSLARGQYVIRSKKRQSKTGGIWSYYRTIKGHVHDGATNQPIDYAQVYLEVNKSGAHSDDQGMFELELPAGRTDTLLISRIGYQALRIPIDAETKSFDLAIALSPVDVALDPVVIPETNGQVIEITDAANVISLDPETTPNMAGFGEPDIFRTLLLLPGISSIDESVSNLNVRGGTMDQNLVLFDGITVYEPSHMFGRVSAFNDQAVKQVSIHRGGFHSKFGGRLSSVIDVEGAPTQPTEWHAGGSINLLNANIFGEAPIFKKQGAVRVAMRRSFSDLLSNPVYSRLFDNTFQEGVIFQDQVKLAEGQAIDLSPSFFFSDINLKMVYRPTPEDKLFVSFYRGNDNLKYYSLASHSEGEQSSFDELKLMNKGISFNWSRNWGAKLETSATLAMSTFENSYGYSFQDVSDLGELRYDYYLDNQIKDYGFRFDATTRLNDRNTLESGMHLSMLSTNHQLGYYQTFLPDMDSLELNKTDSDQVGGVMAVYAQHTYLPFNNLSVSIGGRGQYYSGTSQFYLSPRSTIKWAISNQVSLKGSVGKFHQFVNRTQHANLVHAGEDVWRLADADSIGVSQAWHYIVGGAYEGKDFLVNLELYRKDLNGLLTYHTDSYIADEDLQGQLNLFKDGSGWVNGLDLLVKKEWGSYVGWVSYTLAKTMYRFEEINNGSEFAANHDRRHTLKLVNMYRLNQWSFTATWMFNSGAPFTNIGSVEGGAIPQITFGPKNAENLPLYHRLDLSSSYEFQFREKWNGQVGLSIFNLYNRMNISDVRFMVAPGADPEAKNPPIVQLNKRLMGISPNVFLNLEF